MNESRFILDHARLPFKYFVRGWRHLMFRLVGRFRETVTIRTRQGRLTVYTRDIVIGGGLYRRGEFEYDASLMVVRTLKEHGFVPDREVTLYDVGANIGPIGLGLALSGEVSRVVAVEPEPANFLLLEKNVRQNRLANRVVCLPFAVDEAVGRRGMTLSKNNLGAHCLTRDDSREGMTIDCIPLFAISSMAEVKKAGLAEPSVIWIDVEGSEGRAFRGSREYLKSNRIPVVSEVNIPALARAGMAPGEFAEIVCSIWDEYWVPFGDRLVRYPIRVFPNFLAGLIPGGCETVVFTTEKAP